MTFALTDDRPTPEADLLDIILEEAWKTVRDYWQTAGVVVAFGVASAVMLIADNDVGQLRGLASTLFIAFLAMALLAIGFLTVRVFRRMRE